MINERDWSTQAGLDGLGCQVNFSLLPLRLANKGRKGKLHVYNHIVLLAMSVVNITQCKLSLTAFDVTVNGIFFWSILLMVSIHERSFSLGKSHFFFLILWGIEGIDFHRFSLVPIPYSISMVQNFGSLTFILHRLKNN